MKGRIVRKADNEQPQSTKILARVGSIRIGEKVKNQYGKDVPTSLDYFKADSDNLDYVKIFHDKYGEKPKKIPIVFLSNDVSEVCPNQLELRDNAGKMVAFGDGENFEVVSKVDEKFVYKKWSLEAITAKGLTPEIFMDKLAAEYSKEKTATSKEYKAQWKEVLRLHFIVLGLNLFGYWQLTTFAKETGIPQIVSTIDTVMQQAGKLAMIPFDLCVKKVKSDKSGAKNQYPVLSLVCNLGTESLDLVQKFNPSGLLTASNLQEKIPMQIEAPKVQSTPPQNKPQSTPPQDDDYLEFDEV